MSSIQYVGIGLAVVLVVVLLVTSWLRNGDSSGDDGSSGDGGKVGRVRRLTGGWLSVYADSVRPERSTKKASPPD